MFLVQSIFLQSLEYFVNVLPLVPAMLSKRGRMEITLPKMKEKEITCHPEVHRYCVQPTVRETWLPSVRVTMDQREQNHIPEESLFLQNLEVCNLDSSLVSNTICASSPQMAL